jgi:SSS family solute:Na+ symporter
MRIDLIIIAVYLVAMMAIGYKVSDQSRDVEGYTVGNRNMSGWPLGLSVLGTFLSSITFLALPAKAYSQGNWNAFIFGAMAPIAALFAVRWFVPLYRKSVHLSAYELLGTRFGYWARAYAALSYVTLQVIRIGTVLLLVGLAVEPMLRWDAPPVGWLSHLTAQQWVDVKIVGLLVVSGVVVIIYDVLGGIRAVVWTDVWQVIVLSVGAVWVLAELTVAREGGVSGFFRDIPASRFDLGEWLNWDAATGVWNWGLPSVLVMALYGITENMRNYGADQNYVQRMLAAEDERNAKKSIWIGALGYQPLNVVFCLIGTGLWLHVADIKRSGEAATESARAVSTAVADQVFPNFIRFELPEAVAGLVIAAILAAAMSTVDSSMNSSSMVVHCDLVKRLRKRPALLPEILALRLWTIAIGAFGTGMAAALYLSVRDQSKTILDVWFAYAGVAGGGLFGLFLLAWLTPRLPGRFALAGVLASLPVLAWGLLMRGLPADSPWKAYECPLHPNLVGVVGTATVLAVGALGTIAVKAGWATENAPTRAKD